MTKKKTRISELVNVLRSKNAGISFFGCDLIFKDRRSYELGKKCVSKEMVARLYGTSVEHIRVIHYEQGIGIKVLIQRPAVSGDHHDTDVYGCQQHVPLLSIEVPVK